MSDSPPSGLEKGHLELLLKASRMLSSSLDLQQVLDTLMDQAVEVLGAERGLILLLDSQNGQWVPRSARSLDVATIVGDEFRFSRGVVDEVIRTNTPVLTSDALEDERFRESASVNLYSLRSVMCVPLGRGRQRGVIYLDNRLTRGAFGESQQTLLEAIAGQAAVAMENALLYEELQLLHETSMEKARLELAETQQQLFQSSKMAAIGQLAAGVAHEINNPLGAISLNVSSLRKATQEPGALQRLNLVAQATDRCRVIVQRLLTFARPKEVAEDVIDIAESLKSTLELVEGDLRRFEILTESQLQDGCYILGDGTQISQVFLNFIINARDALSECSRPEGRRLLIACRVEGTQIKVEFRDNGKGMSQEVKTRIFEPFFTTKPVGKGVGLGMSIVYEILNRHSAKIEIETQVDLGTRFVLTFPLCQD
jgi:signal transduction histidine kinase